MARPQLATVNENPAPIPVNDLELSEAERRAVLARKLHELDGLEVDKKAIADDIKTVKGELEKQGFSKDAIKFAMKVRADSDGKLAQQRRAEVEVARFLNSPIGFEPELPLDRTTDEDKAFNQGELAGAAGVTANPPYVMGSPFEQKWLAGWHQGQATIMSAFKKIEAKAAADAPGDADGDQPEYDGED
jgi:uncharacterized protein (UPF0335 family)